MLILFFALMAAAISAPAAIYVLGRRAFGLLALVPSAGFAWIVSLYTANTFAGGQALTTSIPWMPLVRLDITVRLDALSALFSLIILGIGSLVMLYCWGYFSTNSGRLTIFGGQMMAFTMVMYGLVISDNMLLMYVFWEGTSVLSFLLVGYYGERASSRYAASQALMVTALGGLAMLVGIIVLGVKANVWQLSQLATAPDLTSTPVMSAAVVLILAGALTKSAIAPTHFWLPGAMAAPTPVSAYLHSAAMVKAGIYLVVRVSPHFAEVPAWHLAVIPLGIFTMLMSGWMALRQRDLKLILAYGTVSQLGFIMTLVGIGSRAAMLAGLALTLAHSMFKATLFMVVGAIDHASGTRDVAKLSGLGRKEPLLAGIALVAALSMAGVPPLFGFVAKESVLEALLHESMLVGMPGKLALTGVVLGSMLTVAYSCYFLYGAFATKPGMAQSGTGQSAAVASMHKLSPLLWGLPLVLAVCTVTFGVYPHPLDVAVGTHLYGVFGPSDAHLALWHGVGAPLVLSLFILVVGGVLYWQRPTLSKLHFDQPALGSATAAYDAVLDALRTISLSMTATTQRGSLPINEAIILGTLVALPMATLILGDRTDVRMELWDTPVQGLIAVLVIGAAITATVMSNRLSALIFVGMTGYGVATIFALHGAPDLALTQLLVETISMVVFMLVLRKLPSRVAPTWNQGFVRLRAWLSVAVGLSVVVLGAFAMNARSTLPVSLFIPELAKNIAHGSNAVNVLLVDIRAWDTFGEISVLVIVATGVASLVYRTRSFSRVSRRPTLRLGGDRWLAAPHDQEVNRNRSLMVEVSTRILFPSMMALSLYFFFAGHNAPGGGFAGGLVAALAFTLRYLAGGREELEETLPVDAGRLLGVGLLLSAATVVTPLFFRQPPLTSTLVDLHLPLIGDIHVVSPMLFDAGVYLIVIGLVLHILRSLGAQLDMDEEIRKQRARDRARRLARKKVK